MFSLFLSPTGRIKRVPFLGVFIASVAFLVFTTFTAIFVSIPEDVDASTLTIENALQIIDDLLPAVVVVIVVFFLVVWTHICTVLKRSQDLFGSVLFAAFYNAVMIASLLFMFLSLAFEFVATVVSPVANIIWLINFMVLLLMPGKDIQYEAQNAEVFGEDFHSAPLQEANVGTSNDTDLVIKAA